MYWSEIVVYILLLLYFISMLGVVIGVIRENRNPVRTLAWVIVLVTLPILGLVFYFYFGVDYRRTRMFTQKSQGDIKWLEYMQKTHGWSLIRSEFKDYISSKETKKLMTLLRNNSKAYVTHYNNVRILNNGSETFSTLFETLKSAESFIHLEYYIIEDGELLDKLKNILLNKLAQSVEVRIIYDAVGSWTLSDAFINDIRNAGGQIHKFLPVHIFQFARKVNYRNHRKIVVVDGKFGFVGGLNIADRYLHGIADIGAWRDIHLRVEGEAVESLQIIFLIDWYFVRQEILTNKQKYLPRFNIKNESFVQVVASGPDSDWTSIQQLYFSMIAMAKENVYISTPYFMPDETTLNTIKTCAMSGVDVRLLLPYKSDSWLAYWCTRSYIDDLLNAGVKVYWYTSGINHSKMVVVDKLAASVGTANMDFRSFEQNFEINMIMYDKTLIDSLTVDFLKDLEHSTPENLSNWQERSSQDRIKESFTRLFAPLL